MAEGVVLITADESYIVLECKCVYNELGSVDVHLMLARQNTLHAAAQLPFSLRETVAARSN